MHVMKPVYAVTIPVHVSGLLVANHEVVTVYICDSRLRHTTCANCRIYTCTLLPPDDGLLASPKHVEL
jgi:hypothetical protein